MLKRSDLPHSGHNKHLCYLNNLAYQFSHPNEYRALVRGGLFLCKICGRVAVKPRNLCKPVRM